MADEPKAEKGKGLPLPMMLGITFVAAIGVSVILMTVIFNIMMPKDKPVESEEVTEEVLFEPVIEHYPLPTFRCNLKEGGYLKTTIVLELSDNSAAIDPMTEDAAATEGEKGGEGGKAEGEKKEGGEKSEGGGHGGGEAEAAPPAATEEEVPSPFMAEFEKYIAKYRDIILTILMSHTKEEIRDVKGMKELKTEIKDGLNHELDAELGLVKDVYFEEFVTD